MNRKKKDFSLARISSTSTFVIGVGLAVYAAARLGHGPFPFGSMKILKISFGVTLALMSSVIGSRFRTRTILDHAKLRRLPIPYLLPRQGSDAALVVDAGMTQSSIGVTLYDRRCKTFFANCDKALLALLAWPALLVLLDDSWIFGLYTGGYIDPWVYLGYFERLPQYLKIFRGRYYGDRLSWLLPGYVSYHVFPPMMAERVLHMGLCYVAMASLYLILKNTMGRRAGLIAALLMGSYSFFLFSVGWDYIDGAGITYYLLTILASTYAANLRRFWLWTGLSGFFCGAMVHSQLFLIVFTPILLLHLLFSVTRQVGASSRWVIASWSVAAFVTGMCAVTTLLGAVSRLLGGGFLFFLPSFQMAHQLVYKGNPWLADPYSWLRRAEWLIFPAIAVLNGCAFLLSHRKPTNNQRWHIARFFQFFFFANVAIMVAWQFWRQPVLQLLYYASYLIPSVFLALGSQIGTLVDRLSARTFRWVLAGFTLILVLPYALRARPGIVQIGDILRLAPTFPIVSLALGLMAALMFFVVNSDSVRISILALLAVANTVLNTETSSRYWEPSASLRKDAFLAFIKSERMIKGFNQNGDCIFWYNELDTQDPLRSLYTTVASAYLYDTALGTKFPSLPDKTQIDPYSKVIVLSRDADILKRANDSLARLGITARLISEYDVQQGQVAFRMTLLRLHPSLDHLPSINFNARNYPEQVIFHVGPFAGKRLSFSDVRVHHLVSSENSIAVWTVNRYGRSGGLVPASDCLSPGDACGTYSSGEPRDHLSSTMADVPANFHLAFFSIWMKRIDSDNIPQVCVQNEHYVMLSCGQELYERPDGWILLGNWADVAKAQKLRLAILEEPGTSNRIDKPLLLVFPQQAMQDYPRKILAHALKND